jgi:hypothetical protein
VYPEGLWGVPPQEVPIGELVPRGRDGKWGYVNDKQQFVIEPQFEMCSPFFEGLAVVQKGGRAGYIDDQGRFVIEPRFEVAGVFSGGLAGVQQGGKYGFIDRTGQLVIPAAFQAVSPFSEGLAGAKSQDKYGFVNREGKWVIEPRFELAGEFANGLAPVKVRGQYGYTNRDGKLVIKPQFKWAGHFSEGLAGVKVDGKYGFMNVEGKLAIEPKYSRLGGAFAEGLVATFDDGTHKYGFINSEGKVKIPATFDAIGTFHKGVASARVGDEPLLVSFTGATSDYPSPLIPIKFTSKPSGAEMRITEEWRWFIATDKDYLFSTLEPRPEGNTDRDILLSKDTVYRVFFVQTGHPTQNRKVDPAATPAVMVTFP